MFAQLPKMRSINALNVVRILNHCGSDDHADFLNAIKIGRISRASYIFCIAFLCKIKGDRRMDN